MLMAINRSFSTVSQFAAFPRHSSTERRTGSSGRKQCTACKPASKVFVFRERWVALLSTVYTEDR